MKYKIYKESIQELEKENDTFFGMEIQWGMQFSRLR